MGARLPCTCAPQNWATCAGLDRIAEIQARGLGAPRDQRVAAQLVERVLRQAPSAGGEAGDAAAVLYKLATVDLERGDAAAGLPKLRQAAEAGNADAANALGDSLYDGKAGLAKDPSAALQWYLV
jgi:TPR repeat protein